ncbi:MAG: sulfite exporter TauE/SafE family protein [Thiohalomonadales bacterium]
MADEFTLLSALIAGLLGGVHCAGMCGGIVSALSMNVNVFKGAEPFNATPLKNKFLILLLYNIGRITSYSLAGLLVGGVGWWLTNWLFINKAQMILQIIAALFMLLLGLYLANWSRLLNILEKPGNVIWQRIEPYGRRFIPVTRLQDALLLGIIWGWLPCGLVYSMLIWSMSAGSATQGGLLMLFFGIGTLPNLLLFGVFAQHITKWFQLVWVRSLAGLVIISFALLMIYRVIKNFN